MPYNANKHHRRSIRLQSYDYTQAGLYFVTICTYQRECLLCSIHDQAIRLSPFGETVKQLWYRLPSLFTFIVVDTFVIMPNHVHGILVIHSNDQQQPDRVSSPQTGSVANGTQSHSLGAVIQNFKSVSTRKVNYHIQTRGRTIWQRNYHEHVIHDETELRYTRQYILDNPTRWKKEI